LVEDAKLNSAREDILETSDTEDVWRGAYADFNLQYVARPGYDRDRGPVTVPGVRPHLEF